MAGSNRTTPGLSGTAVACWLTSRSPRMTRIASPNCWLSPRNISIVLGLHAKFLGDRVGNGHVGRLLRLRRQSLPLDGHLALAETRRR